MENGNCKGAINKEARRKRWKEDWEGHLYTLPWLLEFLTLIAWSVAYSFYLSPTDYSMFTASEWAGLKNYIKVFTRDRGSSKVLFTTFHFVLMAILLRLVFALFVAIHPNKAVRGVNLYRTFIYLPSLLGGSVAVAAFWGNVFGINGYINTTLGTFGIEAVRWLTSPKYALTTIVLLNAWQFGSSMTILLTSLKAIPNSLYEVASMDETETVHKFFKITLPVISPVIFFNLVYRLIGAFQQFNSAFLIIKEGPANAIYPYVSMFYEKAFISYQMGCVAGVAWILLGIVGCFTAAMFIGQKFWVFYKDQREEYLQWGKII